MVKPQRFCFCLVALFFVTSIGLNVYLISGDGFRNHASTSLHIGDHGPVVVLASAESVKEGIKSIDTSEQKKNLRAVDKAGSMHPKTKTVAVAAPVGETSTEGTEEFTECLAPAPANATPPRLMSSTTNPIYFLHIGKAGGTSVDSMFSKLNAKKKKYVGHKHFDYSYIQMKESRNAKKTSSNSTSACGYGEIADIVDVVTFLRDPVDRGISQFYFGRGLRWMKRSKCCQKVLGQTLEEYLEDDNRNWTQPIKDGESGTSFLTGRFRGGGWVATDGKETGLKSHLRHNKTASALLAARRLESTPWFGLMEDKERSLKLLAVSLGLNRTPDLPKANKGKQGHPPVTDKERQLIKQHVPGDMWLYEYAKRLLDSRYRHFVEGEPYESPEIPALPEP